MRNITIVALSFICALSICLTGCQQDTSATSKQAKAASGIHSVPGKPLCVDTVTNLMWQQSRSGRQYDSQAKAQAHADKLTIGGYSDWRFPTIKEFNVLNEVLDITVKPDCNIRLHGPYWMLNEDTNAIESGTWESYPLCGGNDYTYRSNPIDKAKILVVRDIVTK